MEPNVLLVGVGTIIGTAVAAFWAARQSSKPAAHQLTKDEGENGSATIRRTLREIQQDVRDTRDLAARAEGRFDGLDAKVDGLDGKVDDLTERVSELERVTGLRSGGRR